MTSRKLLVEQVRRRLAGGNVPNNFAITELEVGKMIDQITNAIIRIQCLQGFWDDFQTPYEDIEIKKDEKKNIYYCELPSKVISLPNQMGVYQVSTMQDQSTLFIPATVNASWLHGLQLNDFLQGEPAYYNEQNKLYFLNYSPLNNTDTLLLKLIVDRSGLDEEEDYQVTPDIEEMILAKTFNFYSGK